VQRGDAVPECTEHVVQARRVGAAGDETEDLTARRDQLVAPDVRVDALEQLQAHSVAPIWEGLAEYRLCRRGALDAPMLRPQSRR